MAYSVSEYLQLLLDLLPTGKAWSRNPEGKLYQLMYGFAAELNRIDVRSDELRVELDTRYTNELLIDHETDLGLPDDCVTSDQTTTERRLNAHAKFIDEGGLHSQSYIDLADDLGFTITITEFTPAWSGVAVSGDACGDQDNIFKVKMTIFLTPENWSFFTCDSAVCGDYIIVVSGTSTLQCILNKHRPAHITLQFAYEGYEFSEAFNEAFDSVPSDDPAYIAGAFGRAFSGEFDIYVGGGSFDYQQFGDGFYKPI